MGMYGTTTTITMTRKELLALLFKLDQPNSAKSLIRKGEDKLEYLIKAIPDDETNGLWPLHPREEAKIVQFNKFMKEN